MVGPTEGEGYFFLYKWSGMRLKLAQQQKARNDKNSHSQVGAQGGVRSYLCWDHHQRNQKMCFFSATLDISLLCKNYFAWHQSTCTQNEWSRSDDLPACEGSPQWAVFVQLAMRVGDAKTIDPPNPQCPLLGTGRFPRVGWGLGGSRNTIRQQLEGSESDLPSATLCQKCPIPYCTRIGQYQKYFGQYQKNLAITKKKFGQYQKRNWPVLK